MTARRSPLVRVLRAVVIAAVAGAVVAPLAFLLTTKTPGPYLGGVCWEYREFPHFDPWSGEPVQGLFVDHSADVEPFDCSSSGREVSFDMPPDLADVHPIPLPIGFALGAAGALGLMLVLISAKPRNQQSASQS
jgi:hypothetical protein